MRTKTILLTAAVCAAGVASSVAQVYSINVVGYINKVVPAAGGYALASNPLKGTSNTIDEMFGGGKLPNGGQVAWWDPPGSANPSPPFKVANRTLFGTWAPAGIETTVLGPGRGMFIKSPTGATSPVTNTFVGEVAQGSLTNKYNPIGYYLSGNLVPDSGLASAIGLTVPNSGQVLTWTEPNGPYVAHNRPPFGSGWGATTEPNLAVAEGFFLNNSSSTAFEWVRNFTVPNTP